jgi:hypothetical protein
MAKVGLANSEFQVIVRHWLCILPNLERKELRTESIFRYRNDSESLESKMKDLDPR